MNIAELLPIFLVGALGSVHCAAMCGGIVGAFSANSSRLAARRRIPISAGGTAAIAADAGTDMSVFAQVMAYNAGRISSYMSAGAIAGAAAGAARIFADVATVQLVGYWIANIMLVLLGLHMLGIRHILDRVEGAGRRLWRHVQPLSTRLLPLDSPIKLFGFGAVWGWLPCGMVYSVLLTAMASGSATGGAATMLAFGLGTLPMMLALGLAGSRLLAWTRNRWASSLAGAVVLLFGAAGIARAAFGLSLGWIDALCIGGAGL